ncbi:MAG: histidinol-phosphatase [Gracilimonas sp.]|uniref:hypothetical protein n=1 Tax=Gracilimonas sp. TaxID=1974203 RepID=UPI0019CA7490|nr:hypothetical protein [Gracilimonas sp.]MBD3615454.1 histidinol-phosphatase [Gracilimonas sp.]
MKDYAGGTKAFLSDYRGNKMVIILLIFAGIWGCNMLNSDDQEKDKKENVIKWYKGSLHIHSYWSNGNEYPENVVEWYKNNDYNFIALSEHNRLAEGNRWMEVLKGTYEETIFQDYLEKFGEEWVEYADLDSAYSVRLKTFDEYKEEYYEEEKFLLLQSEEIHDDYQGLPVHVNATNIQQEIEPQSGNSVLEVLQNNINTILEQSKNLGTTILPQVNHPNIDWAITADDMKQLEGVRFFELFNGHPNARNSGDSNHPSTEEIWDEVNTYYVLNGKPLLYGLAVDDAQNYHAFKPEIPNPGRGWIQVRAAKLSHDSIFNALQKGDFYSSTGVRLSDIQLRNDTLIIKIDPELGVNYKTQFIGTLTNDVETPGKILSEKDGIEPTYKITGNELFIRAKVISDKKKENYIEEEEFEAAWIQPEKIAL